VGVPSPVIPTFTDGVVVHQADLNALGTNLSNLYAYNQAGFRTQRPCVIVRQTTGQSIPNTTDTLVTFNVADVNTDNMWVAGSPTVITIQHAGIYWIFTQARWGAYGPATLTTVGSPSILVNGTNPATNAVAQNVLPFVAGGAGATSQAGWLGNLAAGATIYLNVWQNIGGTATLQTNYGNTFLGAIFLTPST
jgi:hypothetical protein